MFLVVSVLLTCKSFSAFSITYTCLYNVKPEYKFLSFAMMLSLCIKITYHPSEVPYIFQGQHLQEKVKVFYFKRVGITTDGN